MWCGVAATVLSVSAAYLVMLHQRLHIKFIKNKTKKQQQHAGTKTGVQDGPALPAIFCAVTISATSAWSSLLCTCSIGSTQRTKETDRFNASTKPWGALNLFRLRCGTVLGFNPQKHANKHTGTRMSRH